MFERILSVKFDGETVSINGLEVKPNEGDKIDLKYNITGSVNKKELQDVTFDIEIVVKQISSERCQLVFSGNEKNYNYVEIGIYKDKSALVSIDIDKKTIIS